METIIVRSISIFTEAINVILILRAVLSLITFGQENRFTALIYMLTEPVLIPIRKYLEEKFKMNAMFDFSIFIAYFLFNILSNILITIIKFIV